MLNSPYIIFIISLSVLVYGSNLIIENSKAIAIRFNISKLVIGITIIAIGTSFPELIVGILASLKNQGDIAIANVIGSNIANIALVLGLSACIRPFIINLNTKVSFNLFILFISTLLLILFSYYSNFSSIVGLLLLLLFILYMYILFTSYKRETNVSVKEVNDSSILPSAIKLIFGFIFLAIGSEYFINSTIEISKTFGFLNNIAISMSLVAFGTSVPELITSIVALFKKEENLALGNVVGSNIINILLVVSLSSLVNPIHIDFQLIKIHLILLMFTTMLFLALIYTFNKIDRIMGCIFISIYFIFIYINFSG